MMTGPGKTKHSRSVTAVTFTVLFHALVGATMTLECPPSNFSDIPSRVVLSDLVLEGKLARTAVSHSTTDSNSCSWQADFTVDVVHKGDLLLDEFAGKERSGRHGAEGRHQDPRERLVGPSQSKISVMLTEEMHKCTVDMKVDGSYIVFLKYGRKNSRSNVFYWAASPPEISTAKKIRDVKQFSCRTCAQYPKAEASSKKIFWTIGDEIKLKCILSGSPPPHVSWFKNNEILKATKRLHINKRKSSSMLIIKDALDTDGGVYSCTAENVLGTATSLTVPISVEYGNDHQSKKSSHSLSLESMMVQSDDVPPHSKLCEEQTLCENGGVCYINTNIGIKFCMCPAGYSGNKCQDKGPEIGIGGLEDILVIVCIFLMLLLLITTFSILYCIARFRHDFSEHEKRYLAIVGERREGEKIHPNDFSRKRTSDILDLLEQLLPDKKVGNSPEPEVKTSGIVEPVPATGPLSLEVTDASVDLAFHETTTTPSCRSAEKNSDDKDEHFDNIISAESGHSNLGRHPGELSPDVGVKTLVPGKDAETPSSAPLPCDPVAGGRAEGRPRNSSNLYTATKDAVGTGIKSTSGQEMFYDDVNALLIELGVSEDFERKKQTRDQETGLHF